MKAIFSMAFLFAFFMITVMPAFAAFKSFGAKACKENPEFYCYKVKPGETWDKLFRNAAQQEVVMKINRTNNEVYNGMIIAVPKNVVTLLDVAPFPKQIDPPGEKIIYVSLKDLAWGAYDANGALVNWGPISGGKGYCPDIHSNCYTPTGDFAIYRKGGSDCKSTKFPVGRGGAPMPYCMFFRGGLALHGSYDVPGYHASHGCVRLFVEDAEWLNHNFVEEEEVPVIVRQSLN